MRRFVNADVVAGDISNAITLNRFAYANGNPVSMSDPFGLSAADQRGNSPSSAVGRGSSTIRYHTSSQNKEVYGPFISDANVDRVVSTTNVLLSFCAGAIIGAAAGTVLGPVWSTIAGALLGGLVSLAISAADDYATEKLKSLVE